MILSFRRQLAEDLFFDRSTGVTRRFPGQLRQVAQRKPQYLNAAHRLDDLNTPPGNRLDALKGDLLLRSVNRSRPGFILSLLWNDPHLIENRRVVQRAEQLTGQHRQEIDHLFTGIVKTNTQRIRGIDLEPANAVDWMLHCGNPQSSGSIGTGTWPA